VQVEPEHGIPFVRPTARLTDTIAIVRALVRDGVVSHRGETITIERFDLWFPPLRSAIAIYVAALFPRMLELGGQLADGVLLTWPTPRAIARAVEARRDRRPNARGALPRRRHRGRSFRAPWPIASSSRARRCGPRSVSTPGSFRATTACSRRPASRTRYARSKRRSPVVGARRRRRVVPDELIDAVALAGTADTCRERLAAYRGAGLALPIVSPRVVARTPSSWR